MECDPRLILACIAALLILIVVMVISHYVSEKAQKVSQE